MDATAEGEPRAAGPASWRDDPQYELDPTKIRDITSEVLGPDGRLRILPAAYWATTTAEERMLFGARNGIYSFPTVELVAHLRAAIDSRSAIEIGAGNGVLADALDIPATDNRTQEKPRDKLLLMLERRQPVPYGPNVIEAHASRAVRLFKPQVVIGCWVSTKYDPARPDAGGPIDGIDEDDILANCEEYILVGNEHVHHRKKIWRRQHRIEYPSFVYSMAMNGAREFIAYWRRRSVPEVRNQPKKRTRR